MADKILFVDDEENILHSIKRDLRKRYDIHTALSGPEALEILKTQGPFSVIVSDMRMPGMNGIQLLSTVKDLYPEVVRLMLTGNADQETAIEAVNKGQIFRFLNKPCQTPTLVMAIALALHQYRLITAERELLDKTLKGSITVLSEMLSLASPIVFSSGLRIKSMVGELARGLGLNNLWQFEIAALLSQVGCITMPQDILNKFYSGQPLTADEEKMFQEYPMVGARLLEKIPRLETIAAIIANQRKSYQDLSNIPDLDEAVLIGAQILRIAIDFDLLMFRGYRHNDAIDKLKSRHNTYKPELLQMVEGIELSEDRDKVVAMNVRDLYVGLIADQDIMTMGGLLIAPKGQEINWTLLQGLNNFAKQAGIKEPIMVRVRDQY